MYSTQAWSQVRYGNLRPSIGKTLVFLEGPKDRHPAQKRTGGSLVDMYERHG